MSPDLDTLLRTFPLEGPPPRYEAGWMPCRREDGSLEAYMAFRRPWSEDWYDPHYFATWWQAHAKAIEIARTTPDCEFIGGPPFSWGGEQ